MRAGATRPVPSSLALLGCGRWGHRILRDLVQLGCTIFVADPSPAARAHAREHGAADAVASVTDLPQVAGIIVATPTTTHASVIRAAAHRAVPIFCEKPLTADPVSAAALRPLLRAPLFVMDKWRYHPGIECLRDLARSEVLGPVCGLRTTRFGWDNVHTDVDAIWILAPHDLSIACEVLGNVPPPALAVAECAHGRAAGLTAVLGRDPWMILDMSTSNGQRRRSVELYCRDGMAILDDAYADHVSILRHGAQRGAGVRLCDRVPLATELPLLRELRAFIEYLDGGTPPRATFADGLTTVRTLATLRERAGLPTAAESLAAGDARTRA
jgi:predicted dehydrogenase